MSFSTVIYSVAICFLAPIHGFKRIPSNFVRGMSLSMSSFYDIVEKDASGNDVSFSKFKGKVVYGVNVASKCGYTASGYALLAKLSKLKSQGVEVALFPCNQFMGQVQL